MIVEAASQVSDRILIIEKVPPLQSHSGKNRDVAKQSYPKTQLIVDTSISAKQRRPLLLLLVRRGKWEIVVKAALSLLSTKNPAPFRWATRATATPTIGYNHSRNRPTGTLTAQCDGRPACAGSKEAKPTTRRRLITGKWYMYHSRLLGTIVTPIVKRSTTSQQSITTKPSQHE
jgi:hypothetical protein